MRTQSNADTDTSTAAVTDDVASDTLSFRAATLGEAVALAEESLGAPIRVVAANRIRRGGIGGFFASDLGVEVSVTLDDESIEHALERLVAETAADERSHWMQRQPDDGPLRRTLATPKHVEVTDPVVRISHREEEPTMVQVEQILQELHFLTSHPQPEPSVPAAQTPTTSAASALPLHSAVPQVSRRAALPTLPPRPMEIARVAAQAAAASQALAVAAERERTHDSSRPYLAGHKTMDPVATGDESVPVDRDAGHLQLEIETTPGIPSQHQVELAVAAADQLIDSLQRDGAAKRLSVRVVLRTGDQSAVEAEATWESP